MVIWLMLNFDKSIKYTAAQSVYSCRYVIYGITIFQMMIHFINCAGGTSKRHCENVRFPNLGYMNN